MLNSLSNFHPAIHTNGLYTRDYANDTPLATDLMKRVVVASVPFFTLYAPLRQPISLIMGTFRAAHLGGSPNVLPQMMAIVALVSTVFRHRIGMIFTTLQDIFLEISKLSQPSDRQGAAESMLKIVSQLFYLALICKGGVELSFLALAAQVVVNLLNAKDEFKNDRWIEGFAKLLMSGVRFKQTQGQYRLMNQTKIEATPKTIPPKEIREKPTEKKIVVPVEEKEAPIYEDTKLNNPPIEKPLDHSPEDVAKPVEVPDMPKPVDLPLNPIKVPDEAEKPVGLPDLPWNYPVEVPDAVEKPIDSPWNYPVEVPDQVDQSQNIIENAPGTERPVDLPWNYPVEVPDQIDPSQNIIEDAPETEKPVDLPWNYPVEVPDQIDPSQNIIEDVPETEKPVDLPWNYPVEMPDQIDPNANIQAVGEQE